MTCRKVDGILDGISEEIFSCMLDSKIGILFNIKLKGMFHWMVDGANSSDDLD